jgi:non-specific serine/threonine protein kinase
MIQENGAPILLDFGAARHIATDVTQPLTVILKPGYAPIEQFADDASLRQGPWTDIYALGAVLYFAMTGKAPPNSVTRLLHDPIKPLTSTKPEGYSEQFLHAVDAALAVRPEGRPQSIAEFRAMLGLPAFTPRPRTRPSPGTSGGPPTTMKPAPGEPKPAISPSEAAAALHPPTMPGRQSTQAPAVAAPVSASPRELSDAPPEATPAVSGGHPPRSVDVWRSRGVAALGLAAVFGGSVFRSAPPAPVMDIAPSATPAAADAPPAGATGARGPSTAPASVAETPPKAPAPAIAETPPKAPEPAAAAAAPPTTASPLPADAEAQSGAIPRATAVVQGTVRIVIKPWGEVIVDGVSHGVSPPLKRLKLAEGKHTVEVKNPGFPAHSAEIEVAKNKPVTVFYEFK